MSDIVIIQALETLDGNGQAQGRYVLTVRSTESLRIPMPLCRCAGGHRNKREAMWCDEARELAHDLWSVEDVERMLTTMAKPTETEVPHAA